MLKACDATVNDVLALVASCTCGGWIVSIKWPNSASEGWSPVLKNAANSALVFT